MAFNYKKNTVVFGLPAVLRIKDGSVIETWAEAMAEMAKCGCGTNCCEGYNVIPDAKTKLPVYSWFEYGEPKYGTYEAFRGASTDLVAPLYVSGLVANAAANKIVITMSEAIKASVIPATTAFTPSGGKTVTLVEISGAVITLTVNSPYVNGNTITIGYTAPLTNKLQDVNGNFVATFATKPVTNNVAP
jgi:hypothetical protein